MTETMTSPDVSTSPAGELSTLRALEAEAIEIIREVVAEFERAALLFSGGKDSAVLLHVALKALAPAPLPLTLLHVDTGHNLPEVIAFRDEVVDAIGKENLVDVRSPDEFSGKLLAPAHLPQEQAQRGGHIPSAINVPWSKAANEDGTFKSDDDLATIYRDAGLDDAGAGEDVRHGDDLAGVLRVHDGRAAGHGEDEVAQQGAQGQVLVAGAVRHLAALGQADDVVVIEQAAVGVVLAAGRQGDGGQAHLLIGELDAVARAEESSPSLRSVG